MIIFYRKTTGDIFGTVDGRIHDEEFAKAVMISSSDIPDNEVGKLIVPVKPVEVEEEVEAVEHFADAKDGFKIKERSLGLVKQKRVKELMYDVPFVDILLRHEDAKDPLQLINCKVSLDKQGRVKDIREKNK